MLKSGIIVLIASALLTVSATAKEMLRNPSFGEFPNGYACKTPRGSKVTCGEWIINKDSGWYFEVGSDPWKNNIAANGVKALKPRRNSALVFDGARSHVKDIFDEDGNDHPDLFKPAKAAKVRQYVEIDRAGKYELRVCASGINREYIDDAYYHMANESLYGSPATSGANIGGGLEIKVNYLKKSGRKTMGTYPHKLNFFETGDIILHEFPDVFPPAPANRSDILEIRNDFFLEDETVVLSDFYIYRIGGWDYIGGDGHYAWTPVDGYRGFAGYRDPYNIVGDIEPIDAGEGGYWCESVRMSLKEGMHVVVIDSVPVLHLSDSDPFLTYDIGAAYSVPWVSLKKRR